MNNLLFYDIEVFKKYYCFWFTEDGKNFESVRGWLDTKEETKHNKKKLLDIINEKTLVGYNNYHYDDKVLEHFLKTDVERSVSFLKYINDKTIVDKIDLPINYLFFDSLDVSQELYPMPSLKKIEGNLGHNIEETPIDFTVERELTEKEKGEVDYYCKYDVSETYNFFKTKERQEYFDNKKYIVENYFINKEFNTYMRKRTTSLVIELFDLNNIIPEGSSFINDLRVPHEIRQEWTKVYNDPNYKMNKTTLNRIEMDNEIKFGLGGLHSSNFKYFKEETDNFHKLQYIDVASMYPSIIIKYNLLGKYTPLYKKIYEERLKAKHNKNKAKSDALKLILNKLYGCLGFTNKRLLYAVTFRGQTAIYNIAKRTYEYADKLMQINTDSILIKYHIEYIETIKEIVSDWEKEFGLNMEFESIEKIYQANVNNYCSIKDGEISTTGIFGKYKQSETKDCNFQIVYKAITNYLMKDIPIYEIVTQEKDMKQFQYIANISAKFGKVINLKTEEELNKNNRCFVVNKGITLKKISNTTGNATKFSDLPDNKILIFNEDIGEITNELDLNFYIQLANDKMQQFHKNIEEKRKKCLMI